MRMKCINTRKRVHACLGPKDVGARALAVQTEDSHVAFVFVVLKWMDLLGMDLRDVGEVVVGCDRGGPKQ